MHNGYCNPGLNQSHGNYFCRISIVNFFLTFISGLFDVRYIARRFSALHNGGACGHLGSSNPVHQFLQSYLVLFFPPFYRCSESMFIWYRWISGEEYYHFLVWFQMVQKLA